MKRVLFDLWQSQPSGSVKFHGGGEYIKSVFKMFAENFLDKCVMTVFFDRNRFVDDWIWDVLNNYPIEIEYVTEFDDLQKILNRKKFDVFFSGLPHTRYSMLKIPEGMVYVGTIHGLRSVELPSDTYAFMYVPSKYNLKARLKNLLKEFARKRNIADFQKRFDNLDYLVCVSNHTKHAIKNFFPKLGKKVECFYTPEKIIANNSVEHINFKSKFILLISCNRFEKNSYRAILALDQLFNKKLLHEYKVVCVGQLPPKISNRISCKEKFVQLDYVSSEKLEGLYSDCDIFFYPTLNEGFGMPPLEAMKYGKTCVVSGICSIPEVCGDAVYYVNPYDINEMQTRILQAVEDKIEKEKIESRLQFIKEKQTLDLRNVCNYIIGLQ